MIMYMLQHTEQLQNIQILGILLRAYNISRIYLLPMMLFNINTELTHAIIQICSNDCFLHRQNYP